MSDPTSQGGKRIGLAYARHGVRERLQPFDHRPDYRQKLIARPAFVVGEGAGESIPEGVIVQQTIEPVLVLNAQLQEAIHKKGVPYLLGCFALLC